jgi:hypothetical protein
MAGEYLKVADAVTVEEWARCPAVEFPHLPWCASQKRADYINDTHHPS